MSPTTNQFGPQALCLSWEFVRPKAFSLIFRTTKKKTLHEADLNDKSALFCIRLNTVKQTTNGSQRLNGQFPYLCERCLETSSSVHVKLPWTCAVHALLLRVWRATAGTAAQVGWSHIPCVLPLLCELNFIHKTGDFSFSFFSLYTV